jgi:hypothetical protein
MLLIALASIAIVALVMLSQEQAGPADRRLFATTPSLVAPAHAHMPAVAVPRNVRQEGTFKQMMMNVNLLRTRLGETDDCNDCLGSQKILADLERSIEHIQNTSRAMFMHLEKVQADFAKLALSKERVEAEAIEARSTAEAERRKVKWLKLFFVAGLMLAGLGVFVRKRFWLLVSSFGSKRRSEEAADIETNGELSAGMSGISLSPVKPLLTSVAATSISGIEPPVEARFWPTFTSKTLLPAQIAEEPDLSGEEGQWQGANHGNSNAQEPKQSSSAIASGSWPVADLADTRASPLDLPMAVSQFVESVGSWAPVPKMFLMQHECEKRYKVIVKLLRVEAAHFWRKLRLTASGENPEDLQVELQAHAPIIQWSIAYLLKRASGIHQPGSEESNLNPCQLMLREHLNTTTPTLRYAIQTVQPQLKRELISGLRTSPLQVFRFAWLIFLSHCFGTIRQSWPDALENLVETMECNLTRLLKKQRFQPSKKHIGSVRKVQIKQFRRFTLSRFLPWR